MTFPIADTAFATIAECIRRHAQERPQAIALADDRVSLNYAELDALIKERESRRK